MQYCDYERNTFPEAEFLHNEDGTLYHPRMHIPKSGDPPHYADGGGPAAPSKIPGTKYDQQRRTIKIIDEEKYLKKKNQIIRRTAAEGEKQVKYRRSSTSRGKLKN